MMKQRGVSAHSVTRTRRAWLVFLWALAVAAGYTVLTAPDSGAATGATYLCGPASDYSCLAGTGYNGSQHPWGSWGPGHNCTSYAAYRLQQNGVGALPWPAPMGNAIDWDNKAAAAGYAVNSTPAVGSIAQWNTGTDGHVAYVEAVTATYIDISEDAYLTNTSGYSARRRLDRSGTTFTSANFIHIKDVSLGDGSFIAYGGHVYRIAGGAPIYIASWNDVGGPKDATPVTAEQFATLRAYPSDGTFVGAGGYVFRFAGGSPIYVASWNDVGGPQSVIEVSLSTLNNGDGPVPYNHVRRYPADGTFVGAGGYVFRFAGGSPLYVASWNDVGGSQPSTAVSLSTLNNGDGAAPYNHVHKYPADGTFVSAGGPVYKFAGGAPIYVSSWANVGGSQPTVAVSASTLNNGDGAVPYNHVHKYPADGTVLIGLPGTQRYRVLAGAAVPLASAPAGAGVDGVAIANAGGPVPWSHLLKAGTGFHSVVPTRVLDSRTATGGWSGALVAGTPRSLTVTGAGVPTNATAVVMNVTVTAGTAGSFLTAYPTGGAIPNASNINFAAGQTVPNLVTVGVASGGKVSFANAAGAVHVVADVVGYYDDGLTPGDQYSAVTPTRLLDSRTATGAWSAKLGPGTASTKDLQVTGGAVPAGAKAVTMNVTVTDGDTASFLQAWPAGAARPTSSNVNFAAGQTTANLVTVQIGTGGKVSFFNAAGSVHVIADVVGYFDPSEGGGRFHSVAPTRLLDDRNGTGLSGPWAGNQSRSFAVGGTPTIPARATSAILNATVTNASTGSFITLYADLTAKPTASNLNFGPGETRANLSVVRTGTNGKVAIYNAAGTVDIIADTVGYFAPS